MDRSWFLSFVPPPRVREGREVLKEEMMEKMEGCDMNKCGALDDKDKTIAIPGEEMAAMEDD